MLRIDFRSLNYGVDFRVGPPRGWLLFGVYFRLTDWAAGFSDFLFSRV